MKTIPWVLKDATHLILIPYLQICLFIVNIHVISRFLGCATVRLLFTAQQPNWMVQVIISEMPLEYNNSVTVLIAICQGLSNLSETNFSVLWFLF